MCIRFGFVLLLLYNQLSSAVSRSFSVGFSSVSFWSCCSNAVLFILLIEVAGLLSGAFSNKTQKTVG